MRLGVAVAVGSSSVLLAALCAYVLVHSKRVQLPAFAIASNAAYVPAAVLAAVHWNESPANPLLALAFVQLCVASGRWHASIDDWDRVVHEADLLAMVLAGTASTTVASAGVCNATGGQADCHTAVLVPALLVLASVCVWKAWCAATGAPSFQRWSMGLLALFSLAAFALALAGEAVRAELSGDFDVLVAGALLCVPVLWVSGIHAAWGTGTAQSLFLNTLDHNSQDDSVALRYDAVCGTFHVMTAFSTCVLVCVSGRQRQTTTDRGALLTGVASACSSLPMTVLLSLPSRAWRSDTTRVAFWVSLCAFAAVALALALLAM